MSIKRSDLTGKCARCGRAVKACYELCFLCQSNKLVQDAVYGRLSKGAVKLYSGCDGKPRSSPSLSSPGSP